MQRTITNPHWTNNARTVLAATFTYEDGRVVTASMSANDNNPDYAEILNAFDASTIEANTRSNINKIAVDKKRKEEQQKAMQEKAQQEALFAAKLKAFEIDDILTSENREMKSKIRRASSEFEVTAYASALLILEYQKKQQEQT